MDDDAVKPSLLLSRSGARVGAERIALLEAIGTHRSISAAARALGIGFRSAWDAVQAMNNLFEAPLVQAQPGGAKGGRAEVTPRGLAVIAAFKRVERELGSLVDDFGHGLAAGDVLWTLGMKTSARNALRGTIAGIREGGVTAEVTLGIAPDVEVVASLTRRSVRELGLEVNRPAIALIKSSFVILAVGDEAPRTSARNVLSGTVVRRDDGAVTSEVVLELAGAKTLSATITRTAANDLDLKVGDPAFALIKAPHVILAVD